MNYTKVDMNNWNRGEIFKYYIENTRIVMSLTVDLNVTALTSYLRARGLKFYPCMLWIVSKVLNSHDEFKYSLDEDGNLIKWDFISPSYAEFHPEDESFTKLVAEYSDNFSVFYSRFMLNRAKYKDARGILGDQPKNFFDVSCLPWVRYRSFDLHVFDEGKFLAPVITWGKFEEECKGTILPLTMSIHHAVADGFHLSRFFNELQEMVDSFGNSGENI